MERIPSMRMHSRSGPILVSGAVGAVKVACGDVTVACGDVKVACYGCVSRRGVSVSRDSAGPANVNHANGGSMRSVNRQSGRPVFTLLALALAGIAAVLLPGSAFGGLVFSPATNFGAGAYPQSVTTADFNGDGKQDLATANSGSYDVSVLLGTSARASCSARV